MLLEWPLWGRVALRFPWGIHTDPFRCKLQPAGVLTPLPLCPPWCIECVGFFPISRWLNWTVLSKLITSEN